MNRFAVLAGLISALYFGIGCAQSGRQIDQPSLRAAAEAKIQPARLAAHNYIHGLPGGESYELESESVTPSGYSFHFRDAKYDGPGNWCEVFTNDTGKVTAMAGGL